MISESPTCNALAVRKYRAQHKDVIRVRRREQYRAKEAAATKRRKSDPLTWAATVMPALRSRAKKMGIDFDISVEDLGQIPLVCPVLGVALKFGGSGVPAANPHAPSVDRFDNSKGYVKGNVRVISLRANLLKKNATLEEVRAIARYMAGG